MKWIEGFDHGAVTILFRAVEMQTKASFEKQGKNIEGKDKALYEEVVRREYEEMLIETQPSFHPLHQPAIINWATNTPALGLLTMFKGYAGKLTSLQRRSAMRAARAYARGDKQGALNEIAYGASMTAVGSSIIPIMRNGIKMGISSLGVEAAEALGWTDEMDRELGDYGLAYAEKTAWDIVSQNLGLTMAGDALDTMLVSKIAGKPFQDVAMTPMMSVQSQLFRAVDSLFFTDWSRRTDLENVKKTNALLRVAAGLSGLPAYPVNQFNSFINQLMVNEKQKMGSMGYISH